MVVPWPGAEATFKVPPTMAIRSRIPSSPSRLFFLSSKTRSASKDLPSSWISRRMAPRVFRRLTLTWLACASRATF